MDDAKAWYYSRTIWGALIAVAAPILAVFDIELALPDQEELVETILLLIGAGGAFLALVGRVLAKSKLH